ncbi:hypothetical protein P5G61_05375 [Paenibacillus sp. F6_3S_P_1C]|uniref:DUF3139 domain-containing protein n=1 Tax=Paenibacillus vandeheii TaxID=3035917 RepID=A0ABT8J7X5_9BACL|nr:hypothetical protein [Paenibacillus vandeheii]MDN4600647.1 hypothetical protein [Paenibacillus vandeheii]
MKKTGSIKMILSGAIILVLLLIVGFYVFLQFKYNSLEASLKEHLINVEGYKEEEIVSIEAKLSSMPKYPVYVVFSDKYIFTDGDGEVPKWHQLDPKTPQRLKKSEE